MATPSRLRFIPAIIVISILVSAWKPGPLLADPVLIVVGLEYTTPIHFGVSGVASSVDAFAYQSTNVPPYEGVAADLVALGTHGNRPLTWYAHPNWRQGERPATSQRDDLLGIQAASGGQWHPDAIGFLNVGIDPAYGDPPANWRKQLAIELANLYCPLVAPDSLPAFLLETDFHAPPTTFFTECGGPSTVVWVPDNWRTLPPVAAKDSVFAAVRARQVIGAAGPAAFVSLESDANGMSLELTEPIQHLELWGGGTQPVAIWSNSATATIDYSQLSGTEPYLFWFAYGDTLGGGGAGWNQWSCRNKQIFFTSPMPRTGPTSFANPYSAAARTGRMPIKVLIHQHTNISYDAPSGPTFAALMNQCRTLGIDCVLTTDHDPTLVGQLPSFVAAWDSIPPSVPGLIASSGNGPWSSTTPDAPWPSGNVPTLNDQVTIRDGTIVTIDVNATCRSLAVGEGTSGVLEFDAVNPRTLTVSGDLTIASGGVLRSATSGSVTAHELRVTGNLTNNGTLDLSTNGGAAGAVLAFTGPASATFSGSGPVTDLHMMKVNKGVTFTPVINISPTNFTINGSSNDATGFLNLISGTLRMGGTFSCSSAIFSGSASYVIGPTAGFWLDNPNFVVLGNDGTPRNGGLLRITQGTYRIGTRPENVLSANSGGTFDIQGGTLDITGRFATGNAVTYTQSGGTVRVATIGNVSSNAGSFDLISTGSSFTMSGGSIVLVQPSTGAIPVDYRVVTQHLNLTGGTIQIGDAATTPGSVFRIAGALPSLLVRGGAVGATARIYTSSPATKAFTGTTIETGATLELNGFTFQEAGALLTNEGSIDGRAPSSQLFLSSLTPQSYVGAGAVHVYNLTVDNPGGVTVGGNGITVTSLLNLVHGLVHTSATGAVLLASTVPSPPGGSSTTYIDGPLTIERSSLSPVDIPFAVGRDGAFRPILLRSLVTGGITRTFIGEVLPGAPGGTPDPPLEQLAGSRRFRLAGSTNLNAGATVRLSFATGDGVTALEAVQVAQAATVNGAYASRGGNASGTVDSGTVESTLSLIPGQDYLAVGLLPVPIRWDGGAGTTQWGDAANWSSNAVPGDSSTVVLEGATPTQIDVNGTFSLRNLSVSGQINLRLDTGVLLVHGGFGQSGGIVDLGTGLLEVQGGFTRSSGTFIPAAGITVFSGADTQAIASTGGITFHHLTFRGGGAGHPKQLNAGSPITTTGNLAVESTAQLALSAAVPTTLSVSGDLHYGGIAGGANIDQLALHLVGTGKRIGGSSAAGFAGGAKLKAADPALTGGDSGAAASLVPIFFDFDATIGVGASYGLDDPLTIASGRTLQLDGRLDCGAMTIGGAGNVAASVSGVLGTATTDPGGLGATLLNTGSRTFTNAVVEYNAAGSQTINAANHPSGACIGTAGSGTKTLDAALILSASSGPALTRAALRIGAGTTFADGGHRLTLASPDFAHVVVDGAYASSGSGALSFESGADSSAIRAVDGTEFGDLLINFASSENGIGLHAAAATAHVGFRNIVFGGAEGSGTAGGTLWLNRSGSTPVTVHGSVSLVPADPSRTGGGFGGAASTQASVTVVGDLMTTSLASTQPIFDAVGTNTLILNGSPTQTFSAAVAATFLSGATLRIDNPAGVHLGAGSPHTYRLGGILDLRNGGVVTGPNALAIAPGGSVVRTNGHVIGTLIKPVALGQASCAFEIGSSGAYTPVTVAFNQVTTSGELAAVTIAGDHPEIGRSGCDPGRGVNRYYSLASTGVVFDDAQATFTFVPSDLDPGAVPAGFALRRFASNQWSHVTPGARTATSTQGIGITTFGDFVIGNLPSLTINDVSVTEGNAGSTAATFTVGVTAVGDDPISLLWSTLDGTATAASGDYSAVAAPETLLFAPNGPLTHLVAVSVHGDTLPEADETFSVQLATPINAELLDAVGTGTIVNDDQPVLWVGDAAVTEGDSATVNATFTVFLSGSIGQTVTVSWRTLDGTATAASGDYTAVATPQVITFDPSGPFTHQVQVSVHGDLITELDETFRVELSAAQGAMITDPLGVGTILNDDALPALAVGDVSVAEGDSGTVAAVFPVTMSRPSQPQVRVLWATADGSATASSGDYFAVAPPETLTFDLGGPLATSVTVMVAGDLAAEPDEDFFLVLSGPQNATLARDRGEGIIINDDGALAVDPIFVPLATYLGPGCPNPFSQQTALPFGLSSAGQVKVDVFDTNGRFVRSLLQGSLPAGEKRLVWDGRDRWGRQVASGMYLLRLNADGRVWTRRLLIVR